MSGITALHSLDGRPVSLEAADAMLTAIAHRGSGAPALWHEPAIALGQAHRPTTPEDARECLPLADPDGRRLVLDGRLDNRTELARALGLAGRRAGAMTDGEYIVAAYARWGDRFVEHLRGGWALALWDAPARRLVCAKDPIGWRPLQFVRGDGWIAIASEPRPFFAAGLARSQPSDDYARRYLADAIQPPNATCNEGIEQLAGGQLLTVEHGRIAVRQYWSGPRPRTLAARDPAEYVEEFSEIFDRAVQARLRTQQRVGVLLSGGLDSSYVAAVAARHDPALVAISGHAALPTMDERKHSRTVAGHLGIASIEVDVRDCWSLSRRWLPDDRFDSPHHPPQGASHVALFEAARDAGVGVLLNGNGGDEWLTGRDDAHADALLQGRLPTALRTARGSAPLRGAAAKIAARQLYHSLLPLGARHAIQSVARRPAEPEWPEFLEIDPSWERTPAYHDVPAWQPARRHRAQWRAVRHYADGMIGWRERVLAQPFGIDERSPYFDLDVIEFSYGTPEWVLRLNGRMKGMLRRAMTPLLPSSVVRRRDWGLFDPLVEEGLRCREQERVRRALERVRALPGIRSERAHADFERWRLAGYRDWSPGWRAVAAGMWLNGATPCGRSPEVVQRWNR